MYLGMFIITYIINKLSIKIIQKEDWKNLHLYQIYKYFFYSPCNVATYKYKYNIEEIIIKS